jgi:5-(carboxyamino)imidazole ribonucleotide synthase
MGHVNFTAATLEEARTTGRDCARLLHIITG